jgi:MFS family permease
LNLGIFPRSANIAVAVVSCAVLLSFSTQLSGTAAVPILKNLWELSDSQSAWLTSSVQLGFIGGTILSAWLNLSDVFNARHVFFVSALLGAAFNAIFAWFSNGLPSAVVLRFLTGVALAGIYPVGMKLVASWFRSGLGWQLGIMIGAITAGIAIPYLTLAVGAQYSWRALVSVASLASSVGGLLIIAALSDGPYLKERARFDARMITKVFRHPPFRYTAFGYFGHMWELFAFWSMLTFYLSRSFETRSSFWFDAVPLLVFMTVGVGAIGCVAGGWVSRWLGERRVALGSLLISALMCALSGFLFDFTPPLLLLFIMTWGIFVISDSPQFSALAVRYCPPEYTGTALAVQNGIGFAITVGSIQLLPWVAGFVGWRWAFSFLTIGPFFGAYYMARLRDVTISFKTPK